MRSAKNSNLTWVSCSARDNKIVQAAQGIPPLIPLFKGFGEGSFKMSSLFKVCWRFTRDWTSLQPKSSGSWWLYGEKTKALETLTLPMKTKAAKTTFSPILQKFFSKNLSVDSNLGTASYCPLFGDDSWYSSLKNPPPTTRHFLSVSLPFFPLLSPFPKLWEGEICC